MANLRNLFILIGAFSASVLEPPGGFPMREYGVRRLFRRYRVDYQLFPRVSLELVPINAVVC